ncbi:MAG: molybdopterin-dependent oxidoreductase [Gordonibacter pamelaeae]
MAVLYAPARILYPMKRTGEKGEGKFERCTWDEAIDAIATKLLEQKEQYGPEVVRRAFAPGLLRFFGRWAAAS